MKELCLIASIALILITDHSLQGQNYSAGASLYIVANSGLRLRMKPSATSPTIKVLDYGDSLTVVNTFDFAPEYADQAGWMDGHWIKARSGATTGYIFDGYLSTLSVPDHENQLCIDCYNIVFPMEKYLTDHFTTECQDFGPDDGEDISQTVTTYNDGIRIIKTAGDGWFQVEYTFGNHRLPEVLNLMRTLLVGTAMRNDFENALTFHENRLGVVDKVEIHMFDHPVKIQLNSGGEVAVSTVIFDAAGS